MHPLPQPDYNPPHRPAPRAPPTVSSPPRHPPTAPARARRRFRPSGFAIIISITLLSFLVLLLLSLSLLTRVGTQMAANNLQAAQAQQNALVALNIALGQLDKFAGPDQRTTAPAEFGDPTLNNTASAIPVLIGSATVTTNAPVNPNWPAMGVVAPVAGDRQWTGVWGNHDPGGQIFTKTPTPVFLNWLVSGNEGAPAPATTTFGQVTTAPPAASIVFTPTMGVTPTLSSTTTYGTVLQFASGSGGPTPAVLLVGPNTTGTQSETLTYATAMSGTNSAAQSIGFTTLPQDRFVVAPLVTISASAGLLPGFTGTATKAVGRYGYAVLDEGVKAKVNVRDPFDGQSTTSLISSSATYSARARMQAAQRTGIELVQGFADSNSPVTGSISYLVNTTNLTIDSQLDRLLALAQTRDMDPTATTSATANALRLRFHDLTTNSFGLLADAQRGGLRRDLTAMFEDAQVFANYAGRNILPDFDEPTHNTASASTTLLPSLEASMLDPNLPNTTSAPWNDNGTFTIDPKRVSPKSQYVYGTSLNGVPVENHGPTWDRLRNFYLLPATVTVSGPNASVSVQAADPAHMPITPVIVQVRTYFGMVKGATGNFGLRHYLALILGNPYTVNLVAPKGLNFVFRQPGLSNPSAAPSHLAWNVALSSSAGNANDNPGGWSGDLQWATSDFNFPNPRSWFGTGGVLTTDPPKTLAPPGSVLPIINTGMDTDPGSTNVNQNRLEQNWQAVPDPLASTLGSILFHASDSGSPGASLTIPAGKLEVLIVSNSTQTVAHQSTFTTPPQIEMVPNSNGAIFTSSYVYNTTQGVAAGTKYSQINYGDNLSLYMLDPNYTPLPGDTLTYSVGGVKVGRVLQALVGYTLTQGGASAQGNLLFSDGTMYNNGGGFTLDLALAKGTSWPQSNSTVSGVSLVRGNYYRTYVDYGLTNVYRTRPAYMPNGPNWLFQTTGNVDNSLGYFDGDGQGNSALVNFDIYTAGLTFAGSIGWGYDVDTPYANSSTVMFDLPRKPYAGGGNQEEPVMSLGYLRHANLSADDEYLSPGYQPASQIGPSFFCPPVTRTASLQPHANAYFSGALGPGNRANVTTYYDMSYLLNAAFWDSCFFSTIPTGATSSGLPDNSRFKFNAGPIPSKAQLGVTGNTATVSDALNSSQFLPKEYAPARYLMLDGAFNINSTSVEAWKALLAGLRRRAAGNTDSELSTKPSAFPRSLNQPFDSTGADNVGSLTSPSTFGSHGGFRRLTDAQITALATNIVLEIRARGPFLSLAHFINRTGLTGTVSSTLSLSTPAAINDPHTLAGALQIAIERTGLNAGFPGQPLNTPNINNNATVTSTDFALGVWDKGYKNEKGVTPPLLPLYADPFPTGNSTTVTFSWATLNRSTGIPGWFTQADLLEPLGPELAARSDTFVIRAYGDVVDPVNTTNPASPVILARAWCEAVVQRFPDYGDPTDQPYVHPSLADATNRTFGRKFRVVSLRWLTPNDI
jgi:hypothetical protein